jgi:hypothetical protein
MAVEKWLIAVHSAPRSQFGEMVTIEQDMVG